MHHNAHSLLPTANSIYTDIYTFLVSLLCAIESATHFQLCTARTSGVAVVSVLPCLDIAR